MKIKINWSGKSHNFSLAEKKYLTNVLDSDVLTQGIQKEKFENSLRAYLNKKNVYSVNSAASALELIAILLQIKKGDEIIIPAHTYCASAIPFARHGAKIVWADIDLSTRTISYEDVKKKISKKTKAILLVHLYGYAADVEKFKNLGKKIKIIEDCAQAFGAEIKGKKVGTIGDFSCYSFHAQKNITTLGEGGAIFVKNRILSDKVPGLRHNGHSNYKFKRKFYWKPAMGNLDIDLENVWPHKFTLSEIQCAAGYLLLKRVDKLNKIRIDRAKYFIQNVNNEVFNFNSNFNNHRHVYHLLSAMVQGKKIKNHQIIDKLYKKFGIKCAVQYYPLYKYPLFQKMGLKKAKCPNTEKFYNNMISFPFHVWMNNKDFEYMIKCVNEITDQL
jgi:perosamine synthetase|tara:strand:- start:31818 stop:32978 length:1161 start_codon:yes stop_codon:yes gene_type:complete